MLCCPAQFDSIPRIPEDILNTLFLIQFYFHHTTQLALSLLYRLGWVPLLLCSSVSSLGTRSLGSVLLHCTVAHAMFCVGFQGGPIPTSHDRNSVSWTLGLASNPIIPVDAPWMPSSHKACSRQKACCKNGEGTQVMGEEDYFIHLLMD